MRARGDWMDDRRKQLGMSWDEVERAAGVTKNTMLHIRRGGNSYPKTIRNVEATLGWALGSIGEIDEGREPRVVDVDAVARAYEAGQYTPAPTADDPAIQLRAIRQRMGATAFWREIATLRTEDETTLGSSAAEA